MRDSKRKHRHSHIIQDNKTPPFPTTPFWQTSSSSSSSNNPVINAAGSSSYLSDTVLPTEPRIRAKAQLSKLKELGLKPKKRQKVIEAAYDDCGEDISGLGKDIILLTRDVTREDVESSDDDFIFTSVPISIRDSHTNVYGAVAHLCYGKHNSVDLLELCRGEARICLNCAEVRHVSRKLHSSANLCLVGTWTW